MSVGAKIMHIFCIFFWDLGIILGQWVQQSGRHVTDAS